MPHEVAQHLIHHYIPTNKRRQRRVYKPDQEQFWMQSGVEKKNRPKGLILGTASTRKLITAWALLNNWSFPHQKLSNYTQTPLGLQQFYQDNVFNGDGAYSSDELITLGKWNGIPVYGASTSGETKDGIDPIEQSRLKLEPLYERFKHHNFILITGDSLVKVGDEVLGKPCNSESFPARDQYDSVDFPKAIETFLAKYRDQHYADKTKEIVNMVGMCALSTRTGGEVTSMISVTQPVIPERIHADMIDITGAAGGIIQKVIDWQSIRQQPDGSYWQYLLYAAIIGMPVHAMLALSTDPSLYKS